MESAISTRREPGSTRLAPLRDRRAGAGRWSASLALCVGALVGYLAFPTYPTYDSFYALLWGRDLLHLHLPDFRVYRGPPSTRWRSPSGCSARSSATAARG